MKLTGKAKVEFEKWWRKNTENVEFIYLIDFYKEPEAMQFGVYVDFADSVEIHLQIMYNTSSKIYTVWINNSMEYFNSCNLIDYTFKNRSEARTAAIEKFNELLNERLCKDISK